MSFFINDFISQVVQYKTIFNHLNLHTNKNKFSCELCDQGFPRSDYLSKHMRSNHTNDLRCPHCHDQFRSQEYLRCHLIKEHDDISVENVEPTQDNSKVRIKTEPTSRDHSPTPEELLLNDPLNVGENDSPFSVSDNDQESSLQSPKKRGRAVSICFYDKLDSNF